jgi:hypothetical protein
LRLHSARTRSHQSSPSPGCLERIPTFKSQGIKLLDIVCPPAFATIPVLIAKRGDVNKPCRRRGQDRKRSKPDYLTWSTMHVRKWKTLGSYISPSFVRFGRVPYWEHKIPHKCAVTRYCCCRSRKLDLPLQQDSISHHMLQLHSKFQLRTCSPQAPQATHAQFAVAQRRLDLA